MRSTILHKLRDKLSAIWKRRWIRVLAYLTLLPLVLLLLLALAVWLVPFDENTLRNRSVSSVVFDRNGQFLRAFLADDDRWRVPVNLDTVSPWMIRSTLAAEDKRFYSHWGVDPYAIARATYLNIKSGRIVSGGSTITMQVAGFLINSRERSLWRKLHQAFLALQLDARWSKREILTAYLTHASYGGNVCGVESAARRYFNKTGAQLSVGEAALLAGIPQSPERFRPDRALDAATRRRNYVLDKLQDSGDIAQTDSNRIKALPVSIGTYVAPVFAPHFTDAITAMYPGRSRLDTTLRLDYQQAAEKYLRDAVAKARPSGVTNGAILILDNQSGDILAMAGSADYWNRFDQGQVNACLGYRSPGSALKPFIYARALDEVDLEPDEILYDVPVTISGYSPMNYDREFRGPISASKALALSLNIPAINVLNRVGVSQFRETLQKNGVTLQLNPLGDPGLSMAIGTCSVRMLDVAALYASLATEGKFRQPRWLKDSGKGLPASRTIPWLTPETAHALMSILSDPDVRAPEDLSVDLTGIKRIAWKTGTSNGFRDAWCFATTPRITVAVWFGNMNGKPSRSLVGGKIAAPVALGIASRLDPAGDWGWQDRKSSTGMEQHIACVRSGLAPGPDCREKGMARFLSRRGSNKACGVHMNIIVDSATGLEVCPRCNAGQVTEPMVVANYPSDFQSWLRLNHYPWMDEIRPAHSLNCTASREGEGPVIVSPENGREVVCIPDFPLEYQKIALMARGANPVERIYWFLDDNLVGSCSVAETIQIAPTAGKHRLKCVDSRGRATMSVFTVEVSRAIAEK